MHNNKHTINPIVITPGEPAGVGPDLVIALAQKEWPIQLVVCADPELMLSRARQLNLPLRLQTYSLEHISSSQAAGTLTILPVSLQSPTIAGELNRENGTYVTETLAKACDGCLNGEFSALVTGA